MGEHPAMGIYVAGGEVLNRLRRAYIENLKNCVRGSPIFLRRAGGGQVLRDTIDKLLPVVLEYSHFATISTSSRSYCHLLAVAF